MEAYSKLKILPLSQEDTKWQIMTGQYRRFQRTGPRCRMRWQNLDGGLSSGFRGHGTCGGKAEDKAWVFINNLGCLVKEKKGKVPGELFSLLIR